MSPHSYLRFQRQIGGFDSHILPQIESQTAEVMPAKVTLHSAIGDPIILNMSQWEGY